MQSVKPEGRPVSCGGVRAIPRWSPSGVVAICDLGCGGGVGVRVVVTVGPDAAMASTAAELSKSGAMDRRHVWHRPHYSCGDSDLQRLTAIRLRSQ